MRLLPALLIAVAGIPAAAHADALRDQALELFKPLPSTIPAIRDNPVTPEKITLGRSLFFDPRLSASGVFSCYSCHNLATGGDDNMETSVGHGYYPFGLIEKPGSEVLPPGDKGRFAVTETADDEYVFRAAPLRNVGVTAPYFHSGKVWDLSVAVDIMAESQLGEALKPQETKALVAFLDSLTGTMPEVVVPVLPAETATTPRPTSEIQ